MNTFENPEDQKLATLASSTLKRTGATQAAALRDSTGRTYVAIAITSPSLTLDAIQAVFTVAMASQISGIEGVVIAGLASGDTSVITTHSPAATIFHIEDLADELKIDFDEADSEDVDTIGGLMAQKLGRVPIAGSTITLKGWKITSERPVGRRRRISSVIIERSEDIENNE